MSWTFGAEEGKTGDLDQSGLSSSTEPWSFHFTEILHGRHLRIFKNHTLLQGLSSS